MDQYRPNSFRSLSSDTRRIPCRWINCGSAKYICNHGKKTAAGRGCPSSRRGPSASTLSHGSSSQSYSLSSTSRTGPRTCFGRTRTASKSRGGGARINKGSGSRPSSATTVPTDTAAATTFASSSPTTVQPPSESSASSSSSESSSQSSPSSSPSLPSAATASSACRR